MQGRPVNGDEAGGDSRADAGIWARIYCRSSVGELEGGEYIIFNSEVAKADSSG